MNGINVGIDAATYSNTTLSTNDKVSCTIIFSGACGPTTIPSNLITNIVPSLNSGIKISIQADQSNSACQADIENVNWDPVSLLNVEASGNNLLKIQSNGNWNGGAASINKVSNNGHFQFSASETNTQRMAGLSTTDVNSNYNTIQYAIYLVNNATVRIYESGNDRGGFGTYISGDVFKISVENNVVKYYQNSNLLYISAISPTLPLLADVSILNTGGTITNPIISNPTTGSFTAVSIDRKSVV